MSTRQRLPNRRPQITECLTVGSISYDVSIGINPSNGECAEVFIEGGKPGSDLAFSLADASVLISLARQYGIPAHELARSMSRIPLDPDGNTAAPASPIGAAIDLILCVEGELCSIQ